MSQGLKGLGLEGNGLGRLSAARYGSHFIHLTQWGWMEAEGLGLQFHYMASAISVSGFGLHGLLFGVRFAVSGAGFGI